MSPLSTSSNLNINMEKKEIMPVALISDTTGERLVFESRRKAAIFLGVEYSYLKQYLKNGRGRTYNGTDVGWIFHVIQDNDTVWIVMQFSTRCILNCSRYASLHE